MEPVAADWRYELAAQCDLITCSTQALYELLQVMFPQQSIVLVRNSTPQEDLSNALQAPITLCWTGAPWTRPEDLALLRPLAH